MDIEKAIALMIKAHNDTLDLDSNPVVLHPMAVGLMGKNDLQIKAGFLHDVVEDSNITLEDLKNEGAEPELIEVLNLLTHKENVSYNDYINNIIESKNKTALIVKRNDLRHNLERGIKGCHEKQSLKYCKALLKIEASIK